MLLVASVLAVPSTLPNANAQAPTSGLIGHWAFEEGTGSVAADSSTGGHDGVLQGDATWGAGIDGGALVLDGYGDHVDLGAALAFETDSISVSVWVHPDTLPANAARSTPVFSGLHSDSARQNSLYIEHDTQNARWSQWPPSGGDLLSPDTVPLNQWTHLVGMQSGSTRSLYVNGQLAVTDDAAETYTSGSPDNWVIGGDDVWGYWFDGRIDELRVYDRMLTSSEVRQVMGFLEVETFLSSPGCRLVPCDEHTLGFTDAITDAGGSPEFTIDYGEFDHHGDLSCLGACKYWMKFDLTAAALGPSTDGYGGTTPVAHLERWDSTTWTIVPAATVDVELTYDPATGAYHADFVDEFLFGLDAFGDPSITYRLVPEALPWDSTQTWGLQLAGAQGQLVAPPVVLVHGWTKALYPTPSEPGWIDRMETHLRNDAMVRHGQDPWGWAAGNSGSSDGIIDYRYHNKKDLRDSSADLLEQVLIATGGGEVEFRGPVDIVAHSMGGLVARYLVEDYLPSFGLPAANAVNKVATMGTPHLGAKQANFYTRFTDMHAHVTEPGSGHHYLTRSDLQELGKYSWFGSFKGWRNWWQPELEPVDHADFDFRMADFQLKADGNPVLRGLNEATGAPGVEYLLIAGHTAGSELYGGKPGDQVVSVESATLGRDPDHCFRVESLAATKQHNHLPDQESVRADIRQFLAGTGSDLCQTPTEAQRPTLQDHLVRWTTLRNPVPILSFSSVSAASTLVEVARFEWDLQGHDGVAVQLVGLPGSLASLDLELVAPNGDTSLRSGGGTLNATWHPLVSAWMDSVAVATPSALDGDWVLRVLGPDGYVDPLAAVPSLDTEARMEDLTEDVVPVGEETIFQVRLTDAGAAVLGAAVEVLVGDDAGSDAVVVDLRDDGSGADATAGDGIYSGAWAEPREGSFLYEVTASWPGYQRQVGGEVAVAAPDEGAPGGACGSATALPFALLEGVLTMDLGRAEDCAENLASVLP